MPVLVLMLVLGNVFMTIAWFLHLRMPDLPIWKAVLMSWMIAGLEYAIVVPAIRAAHGRGISPATIKVTQEAVTFIVFALVITLIVDGAGLSWRYALAAVMVIGAVALIRL